MKGIIVGPKKVRRLMRQDNLLAIRRRKLRAATFGAAEEQKLLDWALEYRKRPK